MIQMSEEVLKMKDKAYKAKMNLIHGEISYSEAVEMVKPYIDEVNKKSIEIAKKYGMKPKKTSVRSYLR